MYKLLITASVAVFMTACSPAVSVVEPLPTPKTVEEAYYLTKAQYSMALTPIVAYKEDCYDNKPVTDPCRDVVKELQEVDLKVASVFAVSDPIIKGNILGDKDKALELSKGALIELRNKMMEKGIE